jgi:putative transposase
MTRHQGLVLRLYPNAEQREFFARSFGCVRWVYNDALAHCQAQREAGQKHPSSAELQRRLPALKKEHEWLAEVDSQALQKAVQALDAAFGHFFRRCKNGETPGYPRFKSRHDGRNSFTCTTASTLAIDLSGRRIKLPKIGWVRFRGGREYEGKIKRVTVRMNCAGIYTATALIESEAEPPCTPTVDLNPLGIDVGCKTEGERHQFATLSSGEIIHSPALIKQNARRLARLQRRLAKKQKGSANRAKLKARIAKLHWKIKNQRSDFLHKTTHRLTRENQALAVEDLNVKGMMAAPKPKQDEDGNYLPNGAARKAGLNRSLASVALGEFFRQLEYKCAWRGVALLKVDRFYPSSKTCSACGAINTELTLAVRQWRCDCGAEHHRDINAAINISRMAVAA